jgi:dephospho-CoA kinase
MVFLSTLQVLVGRPLSRSVFRFGFRPLTQRIVVEEVLMGLSLVFPLSLFLAHITIRIAAAGWRPSFVRSDIWTTLLITIVGDIFLEVLLPSLQCLPPHAAPFSLWEDHAASEEDISYAVWLQRTWGFACPAAVDRQQLLSPDAVGTLLTVRLLFMCLGVYLGESFLPIALTGGIACGKTTVATLLLDPRGGATDIPVDTTSPLRSNNTRQPRRARKSSAKTSATTTTNVNNERSNSSLFLVANDQEEGTFFLVDTDSIAHEILLPPAVLAGDTNDTTTTANDNDMATYTVHPDDSVYPDIVDAFGDPSVDNRNILDDNGLIDRRKLGAIVFGNDAERRVLNKMTHPRIIYILLKRLVYGIFLSNQDIAAADVPLLFESGQLRWLFGITIVVACTPQLQLQRLKARNPDLTEQQCRERIASQIPIEQKVAMADLVIWNNGDMGALAEQVEVVRRDVMGRIYGIGMSLLQMLLLVGGSLSLAVSSKLFSSWT